MEVRREIEAYLQLVDFTRLLAMGLLGFLLRALDLV